MKTLLVLALLLGIAGGARPHRSPPAPVIVSQKTDTIPDDMGSLIWERYIDIRNPLDHAVWVYLECPGHLTTNAIGVVGHHTSEYTFDNIAPKEQCWINHWILQVPGQSPPRWNPS